MIQLNAGRMLAQRTVRPNLGDQNNCCKPMKAPCNYESCAIAWSHRPITDGRANQQDYTKYLKEGLLPWIKDLKEREDHDLIFKEDGASYHIGREARAWKQETGLKDFEYLPAQSVDLNPAEHVCCVLEKLI
ncbi:hypothetical protein DFQ29_000544 [Apophysomyces sp. BC1021]|nr:hypothetical protein DFQ29_000544 [Apophysomyces sp. BC1021]